MKKLTILIVIMLTKTILISQSPANTGGIQPPDIVKENFTKKFPNVIPNWSKNDQNFKATFEDPLSHKDALIIYNSKGEIIRSEYEIETSEQPKLISEYYLKNYPKEKFKVWSSIDKEGNKMYFIYRKKEIIWFDKEGNYIPVKNK